MVNKNIIGNSYSIKEIHEDGFINVKVTSVVLFYRKANIFLPFSIPNLSKILFIS